MQSFLVTIATLGIFGIQGAVAQSASLVSPAASNISSADTAKMPPAPSGRSTIFGGEIANLDPVRDQLTLRVYGERPMKILFDERTQVYRDGKRIPLRDLNPTGHASVETTLDGAKLFALSIHVISKTAPGEYEGRVVSYSTGSGELSLLSDLSSEPLKVQIQGNTQIIREGQSAFAKSNSGATDLVKGTLVSVQFDSAGKNGAADASQLRILAVPGAQFAFRGRISSLDERIGRLVLFDPQDSKSYAIFFNGASLLSAQTLHMDDQVRVVANYDGEHYVASAIQVNKPDH
jgi:hypothetical protein